MKPGPHYHEHIARSVRQLVCIGLGGIALALSFVVVLFSL
jgi:hypothetical protein